MTLQTLYDQLLGLRLPAFRDGLREQQANPKCTELSFEDRLALLVDQECSQRRENRIRRNIHTANFPMQANLEDIDFAPARGLDRRTVLELGQCNWIASHHNIMVLGPTASGNRSLLALSAMLLFATASPFDIIGLRGCFTPSSLTTGCANHHHPEFQRYS